MQFDTGIRKILRIGQSGWYTLIAGDPSFAQEVVEQAGRQLEADKTQSGSASKMMHCMKEAYQRCRETAVVDNVLAPNMLTKDLVVARPASLLPLQADHNDLIVNQVAEFRVGSSLLVCGFDARKTPQPHVFRVRDPGICESCDLTGFFAIGVGSETAMARLLRMETSRADDLSKALYGAFDAKVNAEIIQGVGYDWEAEILVVGKEKSIKVPRKIVNLINSVYEGFPRSPFDSVGVSPRGWPRRLANFTRRVLPSSRVPRVVNFTRRVGR
jgi:hypothetical protein